MMVPLAAFVASAMPFFAAAEINSLETCRAAISEDPDAAREDAAIWNRLGGGVEARICEAAALEALGANATAARILTALAENPNRVIDLPARAILFEDGARLWLEAGKPDLALASVASADVISPRNTVREELRARAQAALGDWRGATETLDLLIDENPDDADFLALRAAAWRRSGDPQAAARDADRALELDPTLPEAHFEAAAAHAEMGEIEKAQTIWFGLISAFPQSDFAELARRNLQALSSSSQVAPTPTEPRPGPLRPRPRADAGR